MEHNAICSLLPFSVTILSQLPCHTCTHHTCTHVCTGDLRVALTGTICAYAQTLVGHCLAIKVFFVQVAGYMMGVDDHRVG